MRRQSGYFLCATVLALASLVFAVPSIRAETEVDLELILAVDISGSVDDDEARLLRQGHVAALRDPKVLRAIQNGFLGKIAVTYIEWAGFGHIKTIVGWRIIKDKASAEAFAAMLARAPYETSTRTAISDMIMASISKFRGNGIAGSRRVLDLAGDGANNFGMPVTKARDYAIDQGIVINGIPILSTHYDGFRFTTAQYLDTYFLKCVIGGAGAFVVVASGFDDFARAIKRKMILEIAGRRPVAAAMLPRLRANQTVHRVQAKEPIRRIDPHCLIGEERWRTRDWAEDW
ncbi:MAG TPA: hypothetical protein DCS82_09620 [Rhodospirillaceae bacterium]|nr:hypothetical protein [Rhodospirillaceae bacterium]HAT35963.1 hypothetical protein [Rhodospirillaceae bacterium]